MRKKEVALPVLRQLSDLRPWTFVEEEVDKVFGSFASEEIAWNSSKDIAYTLKKEGIARTMILSFDFSLLQRIEVL